MINTYKKDLCYKIEKIVGYSPHGLGDLLSILVHPDVIELTKKYIKSVEDEESS